MKDKVFANGRPIDGGVFHLPRRREALSDREAMLQDIELSLVGHFREQNDLLKSVNGELKEHISRLTNSVERLAGEMHGYRTGTKEHAFARICGPDAAPDLPTVRGEVAFWYTLTSSAIGEELGFHSSQIGTLLGCRGLNWAGNGDYQEIGRAAGRGHSKFWHYEVTAKLAKILDESDPGKYGITDKLVLSIFRRWKERRVQEAASVVPSNENSKH